MASYYVNLNNNGSNEKFDNVRTRSIHPLLSDLNKIEMKFKEFNGCAMDDIDDWNRDQTFVVEDKVRDFMNTSKDKWSEQIRKHRDIHTAISKFGKTTDKIFNEKIDHLNSYFVKSTSANPGSDIAEYNNAINSLIFDYLLRIGRVEVASVFMDEDNVRFSNDERCILEEVTIIISSMRVHKFFHIKEWIKYNKVSMTESQIIKFQYIVSKLEFLNTLSTDPGNFETLIECAKEMAVFARFFQPDFEYLMGSLAFIHNPERIRQFYSELFLKMHDDIREGDLTHCDLVNSEQSLDPPSHSNLTHNIVHSLYYQHYLNELVSMFSEQVCAIKQCSTTDPLLTLFASGIGNITEFFNHDQIFKKLLLYNKIEDFPLTVKRHDHHVHHSIFHCPVDKAVALGDNSVLRLKCGHAISKSAFNQLTKNEQKTRMKCPYCPTETKTSEVLTLVL